MSSPVYGIFVILFLPILRQKFCLWWFGAYLFILSNLLILLMDVSKRQKWSKIFIVDDMARAPDPRFVQSMQEKGPICLSLECRIRKKNLKYFKLTKTKVMKKSLKGKNNQWTGYEIFIYSLWLDKEKRYIIID